MLAAASYLFTFEALYSHGIVYWHHSLFQVVWLAQLLAFARVSRSTDSGTPIRRRDAALLLATGVLGPATEWTGYIATASLAGICWWRSRHGARASLRYLSVGLLAGAFLAGFAFVAHFVWVIGFDPLVAALRSRAEARSTAHASISALGRGYLESFGALLVFAAAVVAAYLLAAGRRPFARWAVTLLAAAILPLSENLLLAQHATTYHFDRLKTLIALVALFALLIALMPRAWQRPALFSWIFVLAWNFSHLARTRTIGLVPPLATNDALITRVQRVARPCAIYATDGFPRGWAELALGGNIYEDVPNVDSLRALVASRHACQGLYFTVARDPGEAMFVWRRATIYDPASNRVDTLEWSPPARLHPSAHASASIGDNHGRPEQGGPSDRRHLAIVSIGWTDYGRLGACPDSCATSALNQGSLAGDVCTTYSRTALTSSCAPGSKDAVDQLSTGALPRIASSGKRVVVVYGSIVTGIRWSTSLARTKYRGIAPMIGSECIAFFAR